MNNESLKNGEKLVVTENDRRVSGQVHATVAEANEEAASKKRQIREAGGNEGGTVAVKQQLFS